MTGSSESPYEYAGIRQDQIPILEEPYPEGVTTVGIYDVADTLTHTALHYLTAHIVAHPNEPFDLNELANSLLHSYSQTESAVQRIGISVPRDSEFAQDIMEEEVFARREEHPERALLLRWNRVLVPAAPIAEDTWDTNRERLLSAGTPLPETISVVNRSGETYTVNTEILIKRFVRMGISLIDQEDSTQLSSAERSEREGQVLRKIGQGIVLSVSESALEEEESEDCLRVIDDVNSTPIIMDLSLQDMYRHLLGCAQRRAHTQVAEHFYRTDYTGYSTYLRSARRRYLFGTGKSWKEGDMSGQITEEGIPFVLIPYRILAPLSQFHTELIRLLMERTLDNESIRELEKRFGVSLLDEEEGETSE